MPMEPVLSTVDWAPAMTLLHAQDLVASSWRSSKGSLQVPAR